MRKQWFCRSIPHALLQCLLDRFQRMRHSLRRAFRFWPGIAALASTAVRGTANVRGNQGTGGKQAANHQSGQNEAGCSFHLIPHSHTVQYV